MSNEQSVLVDRAVAIIRHQQGRIDSEVERLLVKSMVRDTATASQLWS